jgi:KUP system potassium uptake protein
MMSTANDLPNTAADPRKAMNAAQGAKKAAPLAALTALGIVYGDLGTSPLYTLQTVIQATGSHVSASAALGLLSLLFWTLIITISIKYCIFVMRADNHGEGGILALMSLVGANDWRRGAYLFAGMGLLGAALIYGDGVITPAISVLSALEGVNVATSAVKPYILPIALVILLSLFAAQKLGTQKIGGAFGPIMLIWFVTIGLLGLGGVLRHPTVLAAVNPVYGFDYLVHSGAKSLLILGGVFLCATGGEALYADMGHIGKFPIRLAWYVIVLPALVLSYAGQTAILMDANGSGAVNPFFQLAPSWGLYPLVALATVATVIASQSIITGAFSMTRQAVQLGWLPQFNIRQTSDEVYGQIYVPAVNWIMAAITMIITVAFGSSDKLAGAYGAAVSTTMLLTTFLLYRAMHRVWKWPALAIFPLTALFLGVDLSFFIANMTKLLDGGWIPLTLGGAIFVVMITWRSGVRVLWAKNQARGIPQEKFLKQLEDNAIPRTPGVAVFLTREVELVPPLILDFVQTTGALRETVIALSVHFEETPRIPHEARGAYALVAEGFWRVNLKYGFLEIPNIAVALKDMPGFCDDVDVSDAVFIGARDFITRDKAKPAMAPWRTSLFSVLFRNGMRITDRFNLPAERTLEIARQIEI